MTAKTALISPVVVPKASELLANRLRALIIEGRFATGQMLPTERELVSESALSRASVREALRLLEAEGLIATRPGRLGGSTVTLPGRASVARSVELFVRVHGISVGSLIDCRIAVEPMLARLAALHHTKQELEQLVSLHDAFVGSEHDLAAYKRINLEWHLAVARASRNEPLIAFMEAISGAMMDAQDYREVTGHKIRVEAIRAHGSIMSAIKNRDGKLAYSRMERHLNAFSDVAGRVLKEKRDPPLR